MRLLGIDFGLRRIGLAFAEEDFIQPFGVIYRVEGFLSKIARICGENKIEKIIVGFSEGELENEVREFAKKVSLKTGLPVEFQDETLTSREAIATMIKIGKKKSKRKKLKDAFSAACILEEYLKERRRDV